MNLKALIQELRKTGIVKTHRGASDREIHDVAAHLGVKFPRIYIECLRRYGYVRVYNRGVFGMGPDTRRLKDGTSRDTCRSDFHTYYARAEGNINLPRDLVVLWHSSHQDYECLDTTRIKNGDCPIVYFDPRIAAMRKPKPRVLASGFCEWLSMKVKEQLKYKKILDDYYAEEAIATHERRSKAAKKAAMKRPAKSSSKRATRKR